jgi:hypothetical protein
LYVAAVPQDFGGTAAAGFGVFDTTAPSDNEELVAQLVHVRQGLAAALDDLRIGRRARG